MLFMGWEVCIGKKFARVLEYSLKARVKGRTQDQGCLSFPARSDLGRFIFLLKFLFSNSSKGKELEDMMLTKHQFVWLKVFLWL